MPSPFHRLLTSNILNLADLTSAYHPHPSRGCLSAYSPIATYLASGGRQHADEAGALLEALWPDAFDGLQLLPVDEQFEGAPLRHNVLRTETAPS